MNYAATAEGSLGSAAARPGGAAVQRALVWLVSASVAVVFIEPSPYELTTLTAIVLFFATGLRLRLVYIPLIVLLIAVNVGYSIGAIALYDDSTVASWIATSWYMAV